MHEDTNDGEQMIQAELLLLQKNSPTLAGDYNVDIYYMLSESHWSPLPISFKHIDSTPGWKTFDVTPIVINWKQGLVNHGIQLRLTKGKEILSCEGVFSEGEEDPMSTEPLLIVYANDDSMPTNSLKKRDVTPQQQKTIRSPIDVQNGYCHRKEMVVKADSLRSDGVRVLLPEAFDIGVCDGHCSYREGYPSDYALIFYLHHYNTEGSGIPSRCCVPTSFRKETLLYERRGVYTIKHAGFIVDKCTCL